MLNIINHQRNVNKNYIKVSPLTSQNDYYQKSLQSKCWREYGEKWTILQYWGEYKWVWFLWKMMCESLKNLKIELPFDAVILLLGLYPKNKNNLKRYIHPNVHKNNYLQIVKMWKQSKCPSIDEWINKMCHTHTLIQ